MGRADRGGTFRIPRLGTEKKKREEGGQRCREEREDTTAEKVRDREHSCNVGAGEECPLEGCLTGSRAAKMEYRI